MAGFKSEKDRRRYFMRQTALIIVNQNAYAEKRLTKGSIKVVVSWSFVVNTCGFFPDKVNKDKK